MKRKGDGEAEPDAKRSRKEDVCVDVMPSFSEQQAREILKLWPIEGELTLKQLVSYDDQNFMVSTSASEQQYVLKIANVSWEKSTLDMQNKAMDHLQSKGFFASQVVPRKSGDVFATMVKDGFEHLARLITYIEGDVLDKARPWSPELLFSLGEKLGCMDTALADFVDEGGVRPGMDWDLTNFLLIEQHTYHITDPACARLVETIFENWREHVAPYLGYLRRSIIHNDANDFNVLYAENEVTGLIDFGDMVCAPTVCNVAIACAYAMFDCADPIGDAVKVVEGYCSRFQLTEREVEVLYHLIRARVATSLTMSAKKLAAEPDNEYCAVSARPGWTLLRFLDAHVNDTVALCRMRSAAGFEACPSSASVQTCLKALGPCALSSIVDKEMCNVVVFDFGPGSTDTSDDLTEWNEIVFRRMEEAHVDVGVGRYNEVRPVYTTDAYNVPRQLQHGAPERRNVHIGIDLFATAGTELVAPLDGVVHSFANNDVNGDYGPCIVLKHTLDGNSFHTLYGHLTLDSLDGLEVGQKVPRGVVFARIGDMDVNGGWPPHVHFQIVVDMLDKAGDFPGVAPKSSLSSWRSLCPDPNLILRIPSHYLQIPSGESRGLSVRDNLRMRSQHVSPNFSLSYDPLPIKMVLASGQYMYSDDGRRYLDCVNNVCHVGHCHPRVVTAATDQIGKLNTNTRFLYDSLPEYTERLVATLPETLSVVFMVCTGSEANDLALRIARTVTGGTDVIVVDGAYHGHTAALIEVSPYKANSKGGAGLGRHTRMVPVPDVYRGPHTRVDPEAGKKYAAAVAKECSRASDDGQRIAAFICESILGCAGQIVLPDGYLHEAYAATRAAGGLCIADEVQVGFGRVGDHFWAFEDQGVVPDIVVMGKPIGNGHPMAAVVTTRAIAEKFHNGMEYFNTFGGNPVSCAVGLAVLDVLRDEKLQANAKAVGDHLRTGFRELAEKHACIGDVRGLGLFIGVELVTDRESKKPATQRAADVCAQLKMRGILMSTEGPGGNVLKIKPPMVFCTSDADRLLATIDLILDLQN